MDPMKSPRKSEIICDVELIGREKMIFYYKLRDDPNNKCHTVVDPSPEWLLKLWSLNRIERISCKLDWNTAWRCAIANKVKPIITKQLKEKGLIDENEIKNILEETVENLAGVSVLLNDIQTSFDRYLYFIVMPENTKRAWIYSGEEVNHG